MAGELAEVNGGIAPIGNIVRMTQLIERIRERAPGLPGMATYFGPSGYGKTYSAIYAANKYRAYHVQMKSTYTAKHFCKLIAREMGLEERGTIPELVDRIGGQLALSQRPLLIDEADFLVKRKMIEIVRDLYESSDAPVILIGEERLPAKLEQWERVHGRMIDWVAAQPATREDAKHLRRIHCAHAEIDDALFARMLEACKGSVRRIAINLSRIAECARITGTDMVTPEEWGDRAFFEGRAPQARGFA